MSKRKQEFNLKKLDGVFSYSVFSGFMLSILIYTGIDASETGIALNILETVAKTLGSPSPYLIPAISILVTILEFVIIVNSILKISEHGYPGTIVSGTGFFGTLAVFGGAMGGIQIFTYIGIIMWIAGVFIARISD